MRALLALLALAPQVLFTVADGRIDEASGIARGIRSPGVVYVQNDSGDSARFFAVDLRSGSTAATITVPDARNVDWEDLAVATDAAGTPSVWLADIGDNDATRTQVQLYRVDEPRVASSDRDRSVRSSAPDVWRLRYPDGPHNAESLAVAPGGAAYVFTKSPDGPTAVYRVPTRPSTAVQTLTRIATVTLGESPLPLATGAALSRDGTLLALRTYTDAYVWTVRGGDVAAALRGEPRHLDLPLQKQGEGIAVDGNRLLLDSEGKHQPVCAVAIPPAPSATSSTAPSTTPTTTPAAAAPPNDRSRSADWVPFAVVGGGALVLAASVALYLRRRAAG